MIEMNEKREARQLDGPARTAPPIALFPSRLGLVARDRTLDRNRASETNGRWEFGPHLRRILAALNEEGCDTILFSPWTVKKIAHKAVFPASTAHNAVVLGVADGSKGEILHVWVRSNSVPVQVEQTFSRSSDKAGLKEAFVQDLSTRIWGDTVLIVCGESNILSIPRGTQSAKDPHHVLAVLDQRGVRIILNPIHTYMRRFEMPLKRRALSRGRLVVSVWNRGFANNSEARIPWQAFLNRENVSARIRELGSGRDQKFGVRLGILDVPR